VEVTSVAKQRQPVSEAPAAVSVINQEDVRRSGATSIPDLLRMVPGVQVARVDASRWAVGARGFNDVFQNKLLVLVDGRSVYSPIFSGVWWEFQDYLLEDLERIEVIRGPGATLWGANAVNGVINITSKSARDTQGLLVSAHGSNIEQIGGLRYGGVIDEKTFYRVYGKARRTDDFLDAAGDDRHDQWQAYRGGLRLDRYSSDQDTVTLQGDAYDSRIDNTSRLASFVTPFTVLADDTMDAYGGNLLARWTHVDSPNSDFSVQLYYDGMHREDDLVDLSEQILDLDFQHRFAPAAKHEIIWGAGVRHIGDRIEAGGDEIVFDPERRNHYILSAFVQDDVELVADRFHVIIGSKFEYNSRTGLEVQPSLSAIWTPGARHSLWGAVSRAVRTPARFEEDVEFAVQRLLTPDGIPTEVRYLGSDRMKSEELWAFEAGYRWRVTDSFSFDLAAFFNRYDRLGSVSAPGLPAFDPTAVPPRVVIPVVANNQMDAETYGLELAAQWQVSEKWRLACAFTFIDLEFWNSEDAARFQGATPRHQLHLRSYYDITRDLEFNASALYVDNLPAHDIPSYVRLDLGLTWRLNEGMSLSAGAANLLDDRHPEFSGQNSQALGAEVPRSFYVQFQMHM
jgi:iron complex outermembrane receptor protein